MKKIILVLIMSFFVVLPHSLKADDLDFIDLYVIIKQIDKINHTIDTYKKKSKSQEANIYDEQKNDLLKELVNKITDRKEPIGIDIDKIKKEQSILKNKLQENIKNNNTYLFALERLRLDSISLDTSMYDLLQQIRKKIDLFSQKDDVTKMLSPYIKYFNKKSSVEYAIPEGLKKDQNLILKNLIDEYKIKLQTYTEILNYMNSHTNEILPQNVIFNIGMEWLLEKIDHYIPLNTNNFTIAKILLSLITLVVLLGCRKIIAWIVLRIMDFFVKFTRHNKEIHKKISDSITTPISWFLLLWSFDIALLILYYPNIVSLKIQIWFEVLYIAFIGWFVISLLKGYGGAFISTIAQKSKDGFRKEVINLILKIFYFIVIIIVLLAILKHLGFNISAIIASLGIGGLAVALAVKDMLANFFASVMLLFDNSFSQGDWIVCGDIEGTVVEMGLRRTTVRTFDNALLFVPNSELANKAIRNWNRRKIGRRIKMSIGVCYDSPNEALQKCVKEIREMLINNPNIAKDSDDRGSISYEIAFKKDIISMDDYLGYKNTLFVFVDEFADSSINILIYCFTKTTAWGEFLQVKEDIMLEIINIIQRNNLSFAFPSQSIYVETLPKN